MSWVEKKIEKLTIGGGDDYSGLESKTVSLLFLDFHDLAVHI